MIVLQYLRSIVFNTQMYVMMLLMGVVFFPLALVSSKGARFACKTYARWVVWSAGWMVGLKCETRGPVPTGEVLIASKHQSFLDVLMIFDAIDGGKFIMKRELMFAPILGQYGMRIGCIPITRGKRGAAIKQMMEDVQSGRSEAGQLIIYTQGTRVAPGVKAPYKVGTAALYEQMGVTCCPVATNVGLFWPRHGLLRKPGRAVIEFLAPIAPGMERKEFLAHLEREVETVSDKLMAEGGFHATDRNG
jgi:1-acyl-sn-glycerol-3-phosphate acyltransferase